MGEGLCLFSVSSTLLVKDKPLRGAYASLTSVVDTLFLKQAISPPCASWMPQIETALGWPRSPDDWFIFTGRVAAFYRTGGAGKT